MSEDTPIIYAELLSNIRQVSILASLPTPSNTSTTATLSASGTHITLSHASTYTILPLPAAVLPSILPGPKSGLTELSYRLPLVAPPARGEPDSVESPWPAYTLSPETQFSCRSCGAVILQSEKVEVWRNLPSENWAEMMDFWHCHKPHEHGEHGHEDDDPNSNKGYGANAKFLARRGIGFVDLTTFLLTDEDCCGVEVTPAPTEETPSYQSLRCTACTRYIGHIDAQAEGNRLYKWRLTASTTSSKTTKNSDPSSLTKPSVASIITSQLHSIMLAQCSSKLLLLPLNFTPSTQPLPPPPKQTSTKAETILHLWILTPTLRFSSSALPSPLLPAGKAGMKIFWKLVPREEGEKMMDDEKIEEVYLPEEVIEELRVELKGSGDLLPRSGRVFAGWEVGILERFEGS